jgi:hypothetical protein
VFFTLGIRAGYVISPLMDFKLDVGLHAVFTEDAATLVNFVHHAEGDICQAQLAE